MQFQLHLPWFSKTKHQSAVVSGIVGRMWCLTLKHSKRRVVQSGSRVEQYGDTFLMMYNGTSMTFWDFLASCSLMWQCEDDGTRDVWAALTSLFPTWYPSWVSKPCSPPIALSNPPCIHWPLSFHGNSKRRSCEARVIYLICWRLI